MKMANVLGIVNEWELHMFPDGQTFSTNLWITIYKILAAYLKYEDMTHTY